MEVRSACEAAKATAEQAKATDKVVATQAIGATTTQGKEGLNLSIGQGGEDIAEVEDPSTTST